MVGAEREGELVLGTEEDDPESKLVEAILATFTAAKTPLTPASIGPNGGGIVKAACTALIPSITALVMLKALSTSNCFLRILSSSAAFPFAAFNCV